MGPAARRASRARLDNAVFVVARAESLPDDLRGVADLVTVSFPWGSLLRGIVGDGADDDVIASLAAVCRPRAAITVTWSVTERDPLGWKVSPESEIRERFAAAGLVVTELRSASAAEVAASGSSWAKRLGVGPRRPATILRARAGRARHLPVQPRGPSCR